VSETTPLLILWDIDHTLVSITGIGREVYARAFLQVTGRPLVHLADMAGRTEEAIVTETLALNGVEVGAAYPLSDLYAAISSAAMEMAEQLRSNGRALPGARSALAAFKTSGAVQSLVTGNLPQVAALKLEAFGLDGFVDLEVGGYGSDGSDRAQLVRLAISRAEAKYGHGFTAEHAVVIGDTPHDVRGARDNGALAVGVATGSSSMDELASALADVVLPDLADLSALHDFLLARR
jgi:phosphoglycolate phosphatase-like HAD superfamily hydrolase